MKVKVLNPIPVGAVLAQIPAAKEGEAAVEISVLVPVHVAMPKPGDEIEVDLVKDGEKIMHGMYSPPAPVAPEEKASSRKGK